MWLVMKNTVVNLQRKIQIQYAETETLEKKLCTQTQLFFPDLQLKLFIYLIVHVLVPCCVILVCNLVNFYHNCFTSPEID